MASLNTLRTKFGVALSVVIALALLAFIFSLRTEMGFSDNDPKVGVINGDKISYSEYINEYETVKANNGGSEASDEQADALANATWQALVAKHLLIPGFEDMGIAVSDAERMAMISGEHPSQVFYNAFADPQTGGYDVAMITSDLSQMSANPQYQVVSEFAGRARPHDVEIHGCRQGWRLRQLFGGGAGCGRRQREPLGPFGSSQVQYDRRFDRNGVECRDQEVLRRA